MPRSYVRCGCGDIDGCYKCRAREVARRKRNGEPALPDRRVKHGKSRRTLLGGHAGTAFASWQSMLQRCHQPSSVSYERYGGRGITVCDRWRESFDAFLADMGERPDGLTIDRIDVNGDYEPGNCRWADAHEQQANRRDTRLAFEALQRREGGERPPDIAVAMGVTDGTIHKRIRRARALRQEGLIPAGIAAPSKPQPEGQLALDGEAA